MSILRINNRLLSILSFGRTPSIALKADLCYHYCGQRTTYIRTFHSTSMLFDKQSKTINLLKKVSIDVSMIKTSSTKYIIIKRKLLWQRIVYELKHYYNGFRLLFIETKIAIRLLPQVLNGHTLTRKERKQFTRTMGDLVRLVPFSVFIIVPFMEFTLPIFLKLFPNMLPSTFKEADKEQEKLKKQLKIKLDVAKFLQTTLVDTALKSTKKHFDDTLTTQFEDFMQKMCSTSVQLSTEEIMKFSSLFDNTLTLDDLDHLQLIALCKLLGIKFVGPDYYLRFTLHLKLRHLKVDDKLIEDEGIENLNQEELQVVCNERGISSFDVSIEYLQSQLKQWLDLHLNKRIPSTILLLSRVLYLSENKLNGTIQSLTTAVNSTTVNEIDDNPQRIEVSKREEQAINKTLLDISRTGFIIDQDKIDDRFGFTFEQLVNQKTVKVDIKEYQESINTFERFRYLTNTRSAKTLPTRIDKLAIDLDQLSQTPDKRQEIR